jgi:hypothetical protein
MVKAVPGAMGTGPITLNSGTLDLVPLPGTGSVPNSLAAAGLIGASTLLLNATSAASSCVFSGSLSVPAGATLNVAADSSSTANQGYRLTVNGSTSLGGTVSLANNGTGAAFLTLGGTLGASTPVGGSIGTITANLTLANTSTYVAVLGGASAGQDDNLSVSGSATLTGGNLQLAYANGFAPTVGQTFTILHTSGSLSGAFAQGATLASGNTTYAISYNAKSVVLTVTRVSPVTQLILSVPSTATAGASFNLTVTAEDASGHTGVGFDATVILSSSAGADISPTSVTLSGGGATIPITLTAAGTQTLTASFAGLTPGTGSVTVNPGTFAKYRVTIVGGGAVTAGNGFLIEAQAADALGNPIAGGYSGPSSVTVDSNPSVTFSGLPATVALGINGVGFAPATLDIAGSYTITAAGGTFTGVSAPVNVAAGAAAKLGFATEPTGTATGLPLPTVSVQVQDQFGNVVTTDNTDAVTLSVSGGPGSFTPGSTTTVTVHNGVADFSNLVLTIPGTYTLGEVIATSYIGPISNPFSITPLQVVAGSFTGTPSGYSLQFNAPFLVNSVTPALYGSGFGASATVTPTVTLTQTTGTPPAGNTLPYQVPGSLVVNAASNSLTFVETNTASIVGNGTPLLPDGTYVVDIHSSGANGLQALYSGGGYLDGTRAGTPGHDFTATFTVGAGAAHDDVLWVPATADGPGEALSAPGKNQAGGGYPVYLSDQTGMVTSVQATLTYNPALLTVTTTSTATFNVMVPTPGTAVLTYSGPAMATGQEIPLGYLIANVPAGTTTNPTPYKAKDLLHLANVSLNDGTIPVVLSDGLHLVAYVDDADGNGMYSSNDAVLVTRALLNSDTGFTAFPLVDPVIVADTDGDGFIPADAALQANEAGVGFPTANLPIPPIPSGIVFESIANNVDPSISIPSNLQVAPDGTIMVPVNIDDPHPVGSTGLIRAHLALTYDPQQFSVSASDVNLGSFLAGGDWTITPSIDQATGQIAIALSSDTPISSSLGGSLVTIDFHPTNTTSPVLSAFQLVASASPNGQYVATELEDAQGTFTLTPAPCNGSYNPAALSSAAPVSASHVAEIAPQVVVAALGDCGALKEDAVKSQTPPPFHVAVSAIYDGDDSETLDARQAVGNGNNAHLGDSFFTLPAAFVLASSPLGGLGGLPAGGSFLPAAGGLRLPDWLFQQPLVRVVNTLAADSSAPFAGTLSPSFTPVFAVNLPLAATALEGIDSVLWDDLGGNLDLRTSDSRQDAQTRGDTPVGCVSNSTPLSSVSESAAWDQCFAQMAAAID